MHSQCKTIRDVLKCAEDELGLVLATQDRAACGNWPMPVMASEFLAWWEDEVVVQRDNAEQDCPEDAPQTLDYAQKIAEFCADLRELGVKPDKLPWEG